MRFGLVCNGQWWKGIGVYNGGGSHLSYELVEVQDAPAVTKYGDFPLDNIELYDFVLEKAKVLGVHSPMYKIMNANEMAGGCSYTFKWIAD